MGGARRKKELVDAAGSASEVLTPEEAVREIGSRDAAGRADDGREAPPGRAPRPSSELTGTATGRNEDFRGLFGGSPPH